MPRYSQFCKYTEPGKRCVVTRGHVGQHDLQPVSSLSVQKILKQEQDEERIGFGEELVKAIDEEVQPSPEKTSSGTPQTESVPVPGTPVPETASSSQESQSPPDPAAPAPGTA